MIAFNEERRISECLRALLVQETSLSYEVIVVDDGSQDSTSQIVQSYRDKYPNVRLIRHEANRGRGAARRSGQESAQSQLVGFVDADVLVPVDWLQRCADELSRCDAVSGIALPDGDCAVVWRICEPTLRHRPGSAEITGNNVLFSREALSLVPFAPDAELGEDFRLAKLMVRSGLRLRTIGDLVVEHRETKTYPEGITWMWRSGVDATSLLIEFRIVRPPDLAWMTWTGGGVTMVAVTVVGEVSIVVALAVMVALTVGISCLFVRSRFLLRPHPLRFLLALVLSPPLILAYLGGRCAGLFRASTFRRRGATS